MQTWMQPVSCLSTTSCLFYYISRYFYRPAECAKINALLKAEHTILASLQKDPFFMQLEPEAFLIGSVAEGTRLFKANEIDVTIKFKKLHGQPFTVGRNDGFCLLVPEGDAILKRNGLVRRSDVLENVFDHIAFLTKFMRAIQDALGRVEDGQCPEWPKGLSFSTKWSWHDCKKCQSTTEEIREHMYTPQTHCNNCRPAVTHSKIGPCLIFDWTGKEASKENGSEVLTVDLIPVFPVKSPEGLFSLFDTVARSLLERSANWHSTV